MLLEQSAAALGAKLAERRQQLLRLLRIRSQWLTGSSTPPPAVAAVGGTIGSHGSTVSSCVTSPSAPRVRQQRHASADADPPPASALPRVCKHRVRHGTSAACACSPTASSDRATAAASADGDASDAESAVTADAGASVAGVPAPAETVSPRDWDATLLAYQRDPPDGIGAQRHSGSSCKLERHTVAAAAVCLLLELLLSRRGASARACHDVVTALYAVMTRDVCLVGVHSRVGRVCAEPASAAAQVCRGAGRPGAAVGAGGPPSVLGRLLAVRCAPHADHCVPRACTHVLTPAAAVRVAAPATCCAA